MKGRKAGSPAQRIAKQKGEHHVKSNIGKNRFLCGEERLRRTADPEDQQRGGRKASEKGL